MESIILELTKQFMVLSTENASLKCELAKFQNAPVFDLHQPKKISTKQLMVLSAENASLKYELAKFQNRQKSRASGK